MRVRGADLSFLPRQEQAGTLFSDGGPSMPPEQILAVRGATHVRLRLWVNPPSGTSDLPAVLLMAKRAVAAGLKVAVSVHYSDAWADPRNQATPTVWAGQGLGALRRSVHEYTAVVVREFALQGCPVDVLQIGNEVTNGMLWPVGQIYLGGRSAGSRSWPCCGQAWRGRRTAASGGPACVFDLGP
jgi:arabinogalactan endo-1,4-beta-galactosidase